MNKKELKLIAINKLTELGYDVDNEQFGHLMGQIIDFEDEGYKKNNEIFDSVTQYLADTYPNISQQRRNSAMAAALMQLRANHYKKEETKQ